MANPMPTTAAYTTTWYLIAISKKLSGTGTQSIGTSRPASIRLSWQAQEIHPSQAEAECG